MRLTKKHVAHGENHKKTAQPVQPNALPPLLRECLVATLADILVRDYEQSQRLIDSTVC